MAYRIGNRQQMTLLPTSIEEYIGEEDPVRIYDAFAESLNLKDLGIIFNTQKVGCPQYNPKAMLKLLIFGYAYGIRSSRKLERAIYHNLSFIWLVGGLKPDHKTIANFRKDNVEALKKVLKQCVKLCIRLDLIEGNTLFVDGTKIRANASINNSWDEKRCSKYLEKIEKHIEDILEECEKVDLAEDNAGSLVKLKEELKDKEKMKTKVKNILDEIKKDESKKSINTTDKDCGKVKEKGSIHAGYNAQVVTDEKHGLIVNSDVVNKSTDIKQFSNQINQANKILGKNCKNACADAGYANTDNLKETDDNGINVIVPSQKQALHTKEYKEFSKDKFKYNKEYDCYFCPEGNKLIYEYFNKAKNQKSYIIEKISLCKNCKEYGICTKSKSGRTIKRLINEEVKEKLENLYESEEGQEIFKKRKQKVELQFGHIKRNLGVNSFLLRGIKGVTAEISILASCFNISRMMTLIGKKQLINKFIT